jgi:transcriptional regulator with XRE-family HTH domain
MKSSERAIIRKRAGLTQHQLSKRSGVHASRISLWENGESELSPEEVAKIAAALHGSLSKTPAFSGVDELARAIGPTAQ